MYSSVCVSVGCSDQKDEDGQIFRVLFQTLALSLHLGTVVL